MSKPRRRTPTTHPKAFRFVALQPLGHSQAAQFAALTDLVAEVATWFFEDPQFLNGRTVRPKLSNPSLNDLIDAVAVGTKMLEEQGYGDTPGNQGAAAVDMFCQRFIDRAPKYTQKLRSGRSIGQRQLLCALALGRLELAAQAMKIGDTTLVATYMADVVELVCEVRRALDREAGSDVASRGARKRHEKTYQIRRLAEALFEKTSSSDSVAARTAAIYPEVERFSKELRAPLTPTRGPKTVYDWLCAYQKTS